MAEKTESKKKFYKISEDLELQLKEAAYTKDLIALKNIGVDLTNLEGYALELVNVFYDPEKMKELLDTIFVDVPEKVEDVNTGVLLEALKDFFKLCGIALV